MTVLSLFAQRKTLDGSLGFAAGVRALLTRIVSKIFLSIKYLHFENFTIRKDLMLIFDSGDDGRILLVSSGSCS